MIKLSLLGEFQEQTVANFLHLHHPDNLLVHHKQNFCK